MREHIVTRTHRLRAGTLLGLAAVGLGLTLTLTACGSDAEDATATQADAVAVADTWVRASDTDATGAFGILTNEGDSIAIVVATSSPSAGRMEIHETVAIDGQTMTQPKESGLEIPAGESATLEPGADHLMLMELPAAIAAGDDVEITLDFEDGSTKTFTATAKE